MCLTKRNTRYQDLILGEIVVKEDDMGGGIKGHLNRKSINEKRLQKIHHIVSSNSDSKVRKLAANVYRSMLGYCANKMTSLGMRFKLDVVEYVNSLALQMGFKNDNLPQVSLTMVQNIGLEGIRGLNIASHDFPSEEKIDSYRRKGGGKPMKQRRRYTSNKNRYN